MKLINSALLLSIALLSFPSLASSYGKFVETIGFHQYCKSQNYVGAPLYDCHNEGFNIYDAGKFNPSQASCKIFRNKSVGKADVTFSINGNVIKSWNQYSIEAGQEIYEHCSSSVLSASQNKEKVWLRTVENLFYGDSETSVECTSNNRYDNRDLH